MLCRLIVLKFFLAVAVSDNVQFRKLSPKIVGGSTIDISLVPYQVSLQFYDWHSCGGVIIHPSWILTAAHCVRGGAPENYTVRAGSSTHKSGGVLVNVSKIIKHPCFEVKAKNNYDVAILKLKNPLKISKKIKPIPLSGTEPSQGDELLVSGWGHFKYRGFYTDDLRSTVVPVVSRADCKTIFGVRRPVTASMICAGLAKGGKDACRGDSGGPAVFNNKLVGVVSWGVGCARANSPGVYANVAKIKTWVVSKICLEK